MIIMDKYQKAVAELLHKVRTTQAENIEKVADLIAESVANGGKIWLAEICHKIQWDYIKRPGAPVFYKFYDRCEDFDKLQPGDVCIVSSVSGRTKHVVDMAWNAIEKGITIVAFTSMEYASKVDPIHESGKKLYEFVDTYVDNCAPAAEAMIEVDGIEARFGAASGMASNHLMWCITARAIEKLMDKGINPGIYMSENVPGGKEHNEAIEAEYAKRGY
jgi:uncharacterized phosphosugar-binding protein